MVCGAAGSRGDPAVTVGTHRYPDPLPQRSTAPGSPRGYLGRRMVCGAAGSRGDPAVTVGTHRYPDPLPQRSTAPGQSPPAAYSGRWETSAQACTGRKPGRWQQPWQFRQSDVPVGNRSHRPQRTVVGGKRPPRLAPAENRVGGSSRGNFAARQVLPRLWPSDHQPPAARHGARQVRGRAPGRATGSRPHPPPRARCFLVSGRPITSHRQRATVPGKSAAGHQAAQTWTDEPARGMGLHP